jgi:hypothetical protein
MDKASHLRRQGTGEAKLKRSGNERLGLGAIELDEVKLGRDLAKTCSLYLGPQEA